MFRKKTKKDQMVEARRRRQEGDKELQSSPIKEKQAFVGLFAAFFVLVSLICFWGQSPASPLLRPKQVANIRISAEFPFSYESKILTQNLIETRKKQVAPVYKIEHNSSQSFEERLEAINAKLDTWQQEEALKQKPQEPTVEIIEPMLAASNAIDWNPADFAKLLKNTQPENRKRLLEDCVLTLRDILRNGVYSEQDGTLINQPYLINLNIQGAPTRTHIQSHEDALRYLRINISAMSANPEITRALYRIIKRGLNPNLVFDQDATEAKIQEAAEVVEPVTVNIPQGQVIIKPGTHITLEQYEQLEAYRKEVRLQANYAYGLNPQFFQNILIAAGLIIGAAMFCKAIAPSLIYSPRKLGLILLVILINLIVLRGMSALASTSLYIGDWKMGEAIAYASPIAFATLLATIILSAQAGVLVSLFVSIFFAMMHGYSLEMLTISILANAVTIYYCRDIRFRAKVVKAGAMAGVTAASAAVLIGLLEDTSLLLITEQAIIAIIMGFITGIAAIGILPLLENGFKFTTDITLLELTDFNHPLLRRMQLTAPGSYHHSLMVANLAERAAASIGANALQCRACALFHDIGKMIKPEYFTENQRDGVNPHMEKNPSMSALVIKSHVKEGVIMARQHKLPRVIIDAIEQHHGTGLIWYFYHRARQAQKVENARSSSDPFPIDESTYRYDGPRPKTRENAILLIADSVEAASRSLKKASSSSIEDLVDKILTTHLNDRQINKAPITMQELRTVRESLVFTLLNTLHQRTEYPEREDSDSKPRETATHAPFDPVIEQKAIQPKEDPEDKEQAI